MTHVRSMGKFTRQRLLQLASCYAAIFIVTLLLSGCGGGGGSGQPASGDQISTIPSTDLPSSSNTTINTVQDIWLYQTFQSVQIDGSSIDITQTLLEALQDELSEPFPLYDNVTFSLSTKLQARILDRSGQVREHIHVMAGVLSDGELSGVVVIATPDTTAGTLVGRHDTLQFDFSALPGIVKTGDVVLVDYYFAVVDTLDEDAYVANLNRMANNRGADVVALTTQKIAALKNMEDDANESGQDKVIKGVKTLKKGFDDGKAYTNDPVTKLKQEGVATVINNQNQAGIPAKARPGINGVGDGAGGCVGSNPLSCVHGLLKTLTGGFKETDDLLNKNFPPTNMPPDPEDDPPTNRPPVPFDDPEPDGDEPRPRKPKVCFGKCGRVANDPHITTLDGRHYSPQPVGEMTALLQTSKSGIPVEMQWRFGPLVDNNTASVITAVAFGFGDIRITLDVERDVLIAVNGEPVDLTSFPAHELASAEMGLVLADRFGIIEIEYADWLFSIDVGSQHLNITAGAMEETADVVGLLGNFDGNPDNDLASRDGTINLGPDATLDDLYKLFLNSWRVTDETSLFDYGVGESTATYTDLSFPTFPEGVSSKVTLATEVYLPLGLDTRQAEGACRRAGISDEPLFGNCVADYVLSGNTEFIVGQQQTLDVARRDRISRFGEGVNGRDMIWWQVFEGNIDITQVVSNGRTLLVRSSDEDMRSMIDAIDGQTGRKLWRLQDTQNDCQPVSVSDDLMVLQADGNTEFGGNDSSDDLLLVNALTGDVLDRWQTPTRGLTACSASLQITSDNTLILVNHFTQRGFSIVNNQFELLWEHSFFGTDEFSTGRDLSLESTAIVKGNNLFLYGRDTADDGTQQFSIYQLDTKSGVLVDRLQTTVTSRDAVLFDAGPSHLALTQQLINTDEVRKWLLIKTPDDNANETMDVLWERSDTVVGDGVALIIGEKSAYSDTAFAVSAYDERLNRFIAEFDIFTGDMNALIPTDKIILADLLLRLQNGEYVIAPPVEFSSDVEPGSPMVLGLAADGSTSWSIDRVEGIEYPTTLHLLDNERLVMVVPLTDILNAQVIQTDWAIVAMGTRR